MFKQALKLLSFLALFTLFFGNLPIQAFGPNQTDLISIEAKTGVNTLELTYKITETFNTDSHGVFIVLPYNQDGVKTNYAVKSVEKKKSDSKLDFAPEKYEQIWELDQFRLRVGDKDRIIIGQYDYEIKIQSTLESDLKYDFLFLNDWADPITKISLIIDGQQQCQKINCSGFGTIYTFNPSKPLANTFVGFASIYWPYAFSVLGVSTLVYILWSYFARDPNDGLEFNKPEFEPPKDIYPWQAQYLINEGSINFKNTFLSFLLWLNNEKYIKINQITSLQPALKETITKQKGKVEIKILKDLPKDIIPKEFIEAIKLMEKKGLKAGLLSSKLNERQDGHIIFETITTSLNKIYEQKPFYGSWGIAIGVYIALFVIGVISKNTLQSTFLVGDSIFTLVIFVVAISIPGTIFLLNKWARLSRNGAESRAYCVRYKYYLEKVEKYKLDFSNNPEVGVQYYLKSVAFAAAFGILPQFQKYIQQILPENTEIQSTNSFASNMLLASFYVPPSSDYSGGFGDGGGGFGDGGGSW